MEQQRLQKLIAATGIVSRRKAEEMILRGEVTVNGQIVRKLGTKADPLKDHIKLAGKLLNTAEPAKKVYVLLNKPKGYLTSRMDDKHRPLVTDLLPEKLSRLHPVGRLDFNTEGLLILTNDGMLTKLITTAAEHIPKIYEVKVKGTPTLQALERLRRGILIEEKRMIIHKLRLLESSDAGNAWYEVTLYQGYNNQIRKMFDAIGHSVMKLKRVRIGHINSRNLPLGKYRYISPEEVAPFFKPKPAKAKSSTRPKKNFGPKPQASTETKNSMDRLPLKPSGQKTPFRKVNKSGNASNR